MTHKKTKLQTNILDESFVNEKMPFHEKFDEINTLEGMIINKIYETIL